MAKSQVHPTAIVDRRVELGEGVIVGAHALIEGCVVIGDGSRVLPRAIIHGPVTIGERNVVYPNCCIGYAPQDFKFDARTDGAGIAIGNNNVFREGVTVHRATGDTPTTIGDNNYLMSNAHVGHDTVIGNRCTLASGALLAGHVRLDDQTNLGGNSAVHQFCRIGRLSMLSGVTAVSADIPPFCTVYNIRRVGSLNLVGLRRNGYRDSVDPLRRAFDLLYRKGHTPGRAIELIEAELSDDPLCVEFATFVRESKRGVSKYQHAGGA